MPFYSSQFAGAKRHLVAKTDNFYYIPLLDTLKSLLSIDSVVNEITEPRPSSRLLHDFCDGVILGTHPLFINDKQALQIVAYYDEIEVANPLGSYVSKHRLGCLFFFLANIRPHFRSTYLSSYFVGVARSEDINHYGIDKFMLPFVDDLKTLYLDGVMSCNGTVFRGALLAFLGDNLASHLVGGFKESISFALRICQSCMITNDQSANCFSEEQCTLRSPEAHEYQCFLLDGPLQAHFSTIYGINRRSVLEDVPGFSVATNLPQT